jgi:hypothetical protein
MNHDNSLVHHQLTHDSASNACMIHIIQVCIAGHERQDIMLTDILVRTIISAPERMRTEHLMHVKHFIFETGRARAPEMPHHLPACIMKGDPHMQLALLSLVCIDLTHGLSQTHHATQCTGDD